MSNSKAHTPRTEAEITAQWHEMNRQVREMYLVIRIMYTLQSSLKVCRSAILNFDNDYCPYYDSDQLEVQVGSCDASLFITTKSQTYLRGQIKKAQKRADELWEEKERLPN